MSSPGKADAGSGSSGPARDGPSVSGEPAILDPAALDRLREWGGEKLLREMVHLFLRNADRRIQAGRQGLEQGDVDRVERAAHSVKSGSGNIGALRLGALAGRLELLAENGDLADAGSLWRELEATFQETRRQLREVVPEEASGEEGGPVREEG